MKISELVKKYDPENQFEVLIKSYQQIEYAWTNEIDLSKIDVSNIQSIIITGLGGSAIGGDLLSNYLQSEINKPLFVNRMYNLPAFANENTLVIASSYSGNTEETLSATENAIQNGCQIICITTGGKLEEISTREDLPLIKLLKGYHPRFALWINIFTLLKTLQVLKLIPEQNSIVQSVIELLKSKAKELTQEDNIAYNIAKSLVGFIPVIYSVTGLTSAVGARLKCQFNENSKLHAFENVYPELNHNEIIGWETFQEKQFNTKLINIIDDEYPLQIKKRIEITSELVRESGSEVINIKSNEANFKVRLFDLIYLGDWISYYLALMRKHDPAEIKNINILKERLADKTN